MRKKKLNISSQIMVDDKINQRGEIVVRYGERREIIPALLFSVSQEKKILELFNFSKGKLEGICRKERTRRVFLMNGRTLH